MRRTLPLIAIAAALPLAATDLRFLDNGTLRIAVDLDLGGTITLLSTPGHDNLINSFDLGRQIQQSYYSGPTPYGTAHPAWPNWPWNPISSGDVYRNHSRILAYSNDGATLHVRSVPMQWALNNVPCECTFDTWITLDGNTATVRARLNNLRTDRTQYRAYDQELPALYTNGPYYRLFTYDGAAPFSGAALRQVENAGPPWASWTATESWAALVNTDGFGVGVFHPGVYRFIGGFSGKPGSGGPTDAPTGYIAPVHREILDSNIRYTYLYTLIAGTLDQVREFVYAHRPDPRPDFHFLHDRQHWTYTNATDSGAPVRRRLRVAVEGNDPQLISPPLYFAAASVPKLYITAAYHTKQTGAELFWSIPGAGFSADRRVSFTAINDGAVHTYEVDMPWQGTVTGIRFDPVPSGSPGEYVDVRAISGVAPATPSAVPSPSAAGAKAAQSPPHRR